MSTENWRALYPFQSHFLQLPARWAGASPTPVGRLHYIDEGPRTEGRAVVMLHGNPTWSFYYRNLVLALRNEHRCIVPDHIGCGLSDKPQNYPYRLADHVANVTALLDHLKLTDVTLVLHDWGGAIGMGAAAARPERIKRLVILNTAAFRSKRIPLRIAVCKIPGFGALAIRGFNGFAWPALYMATAHRERFTPEVCAGLLAPYDSWANRIATLRFVQDIPMSPSHPSWATLTRIEEALPQFRDRPMLIGWGMKDWCFNEGFLDGWVERFPNAEVIRYEDAGHYVVEDAHERIAPKISQFLQ